MQSPPSTTKPLTKIRTSGPHVADDAAPDGGSYSHTSSEWTRQFVESAQTERRRREEQTTDELDSIQAHVLAAERKISDALGGGGAGSVLIVSSLSSLSSLLDRLDIGSSAAAAAALAAATIRMGNEPN